LTDASPSPPSYARLRAALSWLLTLFWAGLIYQLSSEVYGASLTGWLLELGLDFLHISVTPQTFEGLHFLLRKSAHASEYAIFAALIYHSLEVRRPRGWRVKPALWAVLAAGLYALTDEYHQSFVPGRTASLIDCGIDTGGAALGVLLVYADAWFLHAAANRPAADSASSAEVKKGTGGE
jgi:VanZ family protein